MRRYPAWNEAFGRLVAPGERIELSSVRPAFELVETLAALRPGYLQALPTVLELMVAHDRRHLLSDIGLAAVFSFGERLEHEIKRDAEAHLRCAILELYGTAECGYLAGSCPHCGGLHLHAEVALVEVIDDAGAPAQPGEIGRVLVTPFYNYIMPLIRYDHGDFARVSSKSCQITLPAFDEILGKRRSPFVFPGGRQIRPTLPPGWVIECLGAESYQVAQVAPDRRELRIVPGTLAPEQMQFDELTQRIRSMWWEGLQIDYRIVEALRSRSERSKLQVFVQEMPDQASSAGREV